MTTNSPHPSRIDFREALRARGMSVADLARLSPYRYRRVWEGVAGYGMSAEVEATLAAILEEQPAQPSRAA